MTLKIRNNDILKSLTWVSLFSIGFITGKLFDIPVFTMDTNINPLQALSILVTLLVALLISVYFQRNKDINNSANLIIIKRIDKVVDILDMLSELVLEGSIHLEKAPSISKRVYSSLKCIHQCVNDNSIDVSVTWDSIENKHRLIKDLLTNTPAHTSEEQSPPIKVENGKYVYNLSRISEIEKNIEDLKNSIFKTQLEINKNVRDW